MMNKKISKILKITAVVCAVILIIELVYIGLFVEKKSIYFDGINAVTAIDKGMVTVGSNNNNEQHFEKAKITKYNSKKEKKFEKIYNKGYNGAFFDVIVDEDNNLVAVGSYEATKEENEKGIRTALIVKYDKDGNILYEADFQLLGNSKYTKVVEVEDGYIVVGQSVYENMIVGLSNDGGAYIAKYNKELEVEWMKHYGDSKTAIYNDAVIVHDKIYAIGKTDFNNGLLAKYDMDGELEDTVKYEDIDSLGFTGVVYSHGKLFVSGGKIKEDNQADTDALIVQYDLDLNYVKEAVYDNKGTERFNQLVVDEENDVVAIGTEGLIDTTKKKSEANAFNHDGVIAKYDDKLEKIMIVPYGDDRDDYFTDIIIFDDNYLVTGYSSYEDGSYLSKFITYSYALKILEVE